jgi:hypothetical protein
VEGNALKTRHVNIFDKNVAGVVRARDFHVKHITCVRAGERDGRSVHELQVPETEADLSGCRSQLDIAGTATDRLRDAMSRRPAAGPLIGARARPATGDAVDVPVARREVP